MIHIEIELFAFLEEYYPKEGKGPISMPQDSTAGMLINKLNIPDDIQLLILVNGQQSDRKTILQNDDKIFIFTPAAGG